MNTSHAVPATSLLPEFLLHQPGQPPVALHGEPTALAALRSAPPGSTISVGNRQIDQGDLPAENLVSDEEEENLIPGKEEKLYAVLKVQVPKLWMPNKADSAAPAFVTGFNFSTICRLVIKYNLKRIKRDKGSFAAVSRQPGGFSMVCQDVLKHFRPNDPFQLHPLCEKGSLKTWDVARAEMIGINRKIMSQSHSPKVWATVVCPVPHQFRSELEGGNR